MIYLYFVFADATIHSVVKRNVRKKYRLTVKVMSKYLLVFFFLWQIFVSDTYATSILLVCAFLKLNKKKNIFSPRKKSFVDFIILILRFLLIISKTRKIKDTVKTENVTERQLFFCNLILNQLKFKATIIQFSQFCRTLRR